MNNIIIGAAGYTLLLSNFILLILLIKNKFRHQLVPSFYILSASDILNSVLTAIILLINYVDITTRTNYFCENKFILNTDITDKYLNTFLQFSKTFNFSDSHYFNETSCNVKDILMHNAMFLMPFTNAFISLLLFSVQFNLNATYINNKHKNYLQFWVEREQNPIMNTINSNSRKEELKIEKDINEDILNVTRTRGKIPHVSQNMKFGNISDVNKGIVGMSVLGQWLIPILFTGVLYFADYQNIDMLLHNKSTECMYETPFAFYNCFLKNEDIVSMENTQSQFSVIPVYTNYVNNASFIPLDNQNITENDVISKIYDIMHLAFNYTNGSPNGPQTNKFDNYYELSQIKRNMNANIITNDINTTNFETNYNEWTIVDDHNIENNTSTLENIVIIKDNYKDSKLSEIVIPHTMHKCVISTTFLRLYFLMLMCIMYFLPIMLSSVLQVQGKLVCQNVLSKLKEQNSEVYSLHNKLYMENDNKVLWKSKLPNDSHSSKEYNNEEQGRNNIKIVSGHTHNQKKMYEDVLKESIQVAKLFGMIKASLIISIILWTPMFLQAALQVFLCIYVSTWIMDCTFLCAISNCIIRNIFNLKMAKTQNIHKHISKKGNTVYPIEENI